MKLLLQLLLVCGLVAYSVPAMQATPGQPGSNCAQVDSANVECLGMDTQGNVMYRVNFKFSYVKPGTNFIRIYESGQQGTTHTYPFQKPKQSVTGKKFFWDLYYSPVCFTIDVYDVLPNGKVVKCSLQYCVWINCGGPFGDEGPQGPPGLTDISQGEFDAPHESAIAGGPWETSMAFIALAPNPATDAVEVLIDVPSYDPSSSLDIIDLNGNVVASLATAMPQGQMVIPAQLRDLASGTYMVRMLHVGGVVVTPLQVVR